MSTHEYMRTVKHLTESQAEALIRRIQSNGDECTARQSGSEDGIPEFDVLIYEKREKTPLLNSVLQSPRY